MSLSVIIVNPSQASNLNPIPNTGIISISNSFDGSPNLKSAWQYVFRHFFLDAYSDDDVMDIIGHNAQFWQNDFLSKQKANSLINNIAFLVTNKVDTIVVHCDNSLSRSLAVGKYISDYYGYTPYQSPSAYYCNARKLPVHDLPKPIKDFSKMNSLVYNLMKNPECYDHLLLNRTTESKKTPNNIIRNFAMKIGLSNV